MLDLEGISKSYGKLVALDDIYLTVESGEIRGLIGPNGSGKTTLFNVITGFSRPLTGRVIWRGENIAGMAPHVIAEKQIVRTFQVTSLYKELTVLQNVVIASHLQYNLGFSQKLLGTKKARIEEKEIEKNASILLEFMEIARERNTIAGELPGGVQKLLTIANALAAKPRLLLLDEPLAGLNTVEKEVATRKIKAIRDNGVSVVIVEHDIKTIMSLCDRITVIDFGVKIAEGSPLEVKTNSRTIEAYLGKEDNDLA